MSRIHASLGFFRRPGPLVVVSLAYLLLVSGLMIWRGISVSPDYLLLILVPVAVLSGRFLGFLRDWVPFVALFLGYEAVRGIAPKAGFPRHYGFVIRLDKVMSGGVVPSQWLQAHLCPPRKPFRRQGRGCASGASIAASTSRARASLTNNRRAAPQSPRRATQRRTSRPSPLADPDQWLTGSRVPWPPAASARQNVVSWHTC